MKSLNKNSRDLLILLLIVAVATGLRLTRLGTPSLWNDEALSAVIAGGTTQEILTNQFHSLHPPGYYLILHLWRGVVGPSDLALRLLSALMGIGSVIAIYFAGRSLFTRRAGLWAAAITALVPFHLYFSQETRMYSQLFLLITVAILCQAELWRSGNRAWWLLYLLTALLGLYTHYLFALVVTALGLHFLLVKWRSSSSLRWVDFLGTYLLMGILYSPILIWIGDQWSQSSDYWIQDVTLAQFLSTPLTTTVGLFVGPVPAMIGYGIVLALLIVVMLQAARALVRRSGKPASLALVLLAYWVPVVALFTTSVLFTPLVLPRFLTIAAPGLYLLFAWSTTYPKEKVVNAVLVVGLLCVGLLADYNWLLNAQYAKPPVRQAVSVLEDEVKEGEAIVFANDSGYRLFSHYAPQLDRRLFLENNDNPQVRPDVIRRMGGEIVDFDDPLPETFWLVLHQDFEVEEQEAIFQRFDEHYERTAYLNVSGIRMYRYHSQAGSGDVRARPGGRWLASLVHTGQNP